jgi:Ca2+-dependent lipid-binding protein
MYSLSTGNHSATFYAQRQGYLRKKQFVVDKGHPLEHKIQLINQEIPWLEAHWYYLFLLIAIGIMGWIASISFIGGVISFVCFVFLLLGIQVYWSRAIRRVESILNGSGTVECNGRWFGYLDWEIKYQAV